MARWRVEHSPALERHLEALSCLGALPGSRSRYIPASVKREVWRRDQGCCRYVTVRGGVPDARPPGSSHCKLTSKGTEGAGFAVSSNRSRSPSVTRPATRPMVTDGPFGSSGPEPPPGPGVGVRRYRRCRRCRRALAHGKWKGTPACTRRARAVHDVIAGGAGAGRPGSADRTTAPPLQPPATGTLPSQAPAPGRIDGLTMPRVCSSLGGGPAA